jgi:phosphohistidine phosphatase
MAAPSYLVRHAKAEPGSAGGDASRHLTGKGREAFQRLARELCREIRVTRILTSPFTRAVETAALLSAACGAPVEQDPRLASGTSGGRELLRLAAALGGGTALVGHNPEIAEAIRLAGGGDVHVPPGTVAAIDREGRLAWLRPG